MEMELTIKNFQRWIEKANTSNGSIQKGNKTQQSRGIVHLRGGGRGKIHLASRIRQTDSHLASAFLVPANQYLIKINKLFTVKF
jgi:hypothetical protein